MRLSDDLEALASAGQTSDYTREPRIGAPSGWEPGVKYQANGAGMVVTTPPAPAIGDETTWASVVEAMGVSVPDGYSIRLVEAKYDPAAWQRDAQGEDAVTRPVWRYRFIVEQKVSAISADELIAEIKRWKPTKRVPATGDGIAYAVLYGDMQIGKPDGDGTEGTMTRILEKTDDAVARLKDLRRLGRNIDSIYLPQLGDVVEGFNSQGGHLQWRNELTLTEMVRTYRRLLLHIVKQFAPLAENVIVPVVPGNHDEAVRTGDKMSTRYDDSWAIDAASAVADLCAESPALEHVSFVFPEKDELTMTLNMAGTIVGLIHGHQTRGKAHDWWAKQGHGMQPIGDATLLMSGHYHHLHVLQQGAKTHVQIPALDGGSTWFRHRTGADCPPGLVTMLVGNGGWSDLAVL